MNQKIDNKPRSTTISLLPVVVVVVGVLLTEARAHSTRRRRQRQVFYEEIGHTWCNIDDQRRNKKSKKTSTHQIRPFMILVRD